VQSALTSAGIAICPQQQTRRHALLVAKTRRFGRFTALCHVHIVVNRFAIAFLLRHGLRRCRGEYE
jgi:hypothetical protein